VAYATKIQKQNKGVHFLIKTVVKRNGKEVPFDLARIKTAIKKADSSTDTINISDRDIDLVTNMAVEYFEDNTKVSVEEIQDAVEDSLIAAGFTQTAKNYIRYRQTETNR
jgi:ribonucleoside-triphosphate reductase